MKKSPASSRVAGRAARLEVQLSNALQSAEKAAATWKKAEREVTAARQAVSRAAAVLRAHEDRKSGLRGVERTQAIAEAEADLTAKRADLQALTSNRIRFASCIATLEASAACYEAIHQELRQLVDEDLQSSINAHLGYALRREERPDLSRHPALCAIDHIGLVEAIGDALSQRTTQQIEAVVAELRANTPRLSAAIREHAVLFERPELLRELDETDNRMALAS
jgi:hypothetical protein